MAHAKEYGVNEGISISRNGNCIDAIVRRIYSGPNCGRVACLELRGVDGLSEMTVSPLDGWKNITPEIRVAVNKKQHGGRQIGLIYDAPKDYKFEFHDEK